MLDETGAFERGPQQCEGAPDEAVWQKRSKGSPNPQQAGRQDAAASLQRFGLMSYSSLSIRVRSLKTLLIFLQKKSAGLSLSLLAKPFCVLIYVSGLLKKNLKIDSKKPFQESADTPLILVKAMSFDTRKQFIEKANIPLSATIQAKSIKEQLGRDVYVTFEGVIGVGKTSLVRLLQSRWMCQSLFEIFESNPFLTRGFYEDQKAHGFNTEIFFLLSRFRQQEKIAEQNGSLITDYLFHKNWIFAQMNLTGTDLEIFKITYENFSKNIRKPDLVVLLEADLETILRRIYFRDREFERAISPAYIERLLGEYYRYFSSYSDAPVLRVNTCGMDFVHDPEDFQKLAHMIEDRLRGSVQLPLQTPAFEAQRTYVSL